MLDDLANLVLRVPEWKVPMVEPVNARVVPAELDGHAGHLVIMEYAEDHYKIVWVSSDPRVLNALITDNLNAEQAQLVLSEPQNFKAREFTSSSVEVGSPQEQAYLLAYKIAEDRVGRPLTRRDSGDISLVYKTLKVIKGSGVFPDVEVY